ncbi:hypothetical protein E1B28_010690 [Marasmius oreades]|uniref:F-box domain-containing protein n=1 Tax=Marasmius oreades TaxID=181124 RepID=A0A9P7RYU6_9AGAR|nr:uncharacterized protein E1B28_010690 [Marasmius oreades]KAG7091671.1 hypothetical protein E1B28_010690 [Marasmius oreades]
MIPPNIHYLTTQVAKQAIQNTPPHIQCLLRSGQLPSSNDLSSIQLSLQEMQTEIQHHQKIVEESTTRILLLEETSRRYHSILSPIRRIPAEILSFILTLAVKKNRFGPPGYSRSHASLLSSVCAFWRSVTLDDPYIWATIVIDREFQEKRHPLSFDRLKTHLERSKGTSITYEFELPSKFSPSIIAPNEDGVTSTLFGTEEQPRQVGTLKFSNVSSSRTKSPWSEARNIVEVAASRLSFLHTLHFWDRSDVHPVTKSDLTFGNEALGKHITSLYLHPVTLSGAIFALKSFPKLSFATFIIGAVAKEDSTSANRNPPLEPRREPNNLLSLPSLLSLTLATSTEIPIDKCINHMAILLRRFGTPSLSTLSISLSRSLISQQFDTLQLIDGLEYFFGRTTALRHLTIRCVDWTEQFTKGLLQYVPSTVTDLGIGFAPGVAPLFERRIVNGLCWPPKDKDGDGDGGEGVLPKLTHLRLFMGVSGLDEWGLLSEMIQSRVLKIPGSGATSALGTPRTPLKSVYADVKSSDPQIAIEARKLRDEGVHVFGSNL